MTALMNAVNQNDTAAVRKLIAQGVNVNELDSGSNAPLVMAAYLGHNEIVRLLLEAGADVKAVDPDMKATALHAAAYAGRTDAAKLHHAYAQARQEFRAALLEVIAFHHPASPAELEQEAAALLRALS